MTFEEKFPSLKGKIKNMRSPDDFSLIDAVVLFSDVEEHCVDKAELISSLGAVTVGKHALRKLLEDELQLFIGYDDCVCECHEDGDDDD